MRCPDGPEYWEATRALVSIRRKQGDIAGAEKLAREVLAAFERKDPRDQRTADAMDDLAQTLASDPKRSAEELALRKRSLDIRLATHDDPKHTSVVMAKLALADATAEAGKLADALKLYEELQPLGDEPDRPPYLAPTIRLGRGHCLVELAHYAEAIPIFERAIQLANPDQMDPRLAATARFGLAMARWGAGDHARARAAAEQAKTEAIALHAAELSTEIDTWLAAHP